jgi:hypothetical protein
VFHVRCLAAVADIPPHSSPPHCQLSLVAPSLTCRAPLPSAAPSAATPNPHTPEDPSSATHASAPPPNHHHHRRRHHDPPQEAMDTCPVSCIHWVGGVGWGRWGPTWDLEAWGGGCLGRLLPPRAGFGGHFGVESIGGCCRPGPSHSRAAPPPTALPHRTLRLQPAPTAPGSRRAALSIACDRLAKKPIDPARPPPPFPACSRSLS